MMLIQHSALPAKDSHASRHGYDSERSASVDTYCAEHGKVGEIMLKPEALPPNP
jgi:hypothetical protein